MRIIGYNLQQYYNYEQLEEFDEIYNLDIKILPCADRQCQRRYVLMQITKENAVRKIDASGRIIIPKGVRDRLELQEGDEMDFYFIESPEFTGIGLASSKAVESKYIIAASVLEELGTEIPEPLLNIIKKRK